MYIDPFQSRIDSNELNHYGILGMKWGIRRFQPYPKGYKGDGKYTGKALADRLKSVNDDRMKAYDKNKSIKKFKRKYGDFWQKAEKKYGSYEALTKSRKFKKFEEAQRNRYDAERRINKKYDKKLQKIVEKSTKHIPREQMTRLNDAKKEFTKLWREYGHLDLMRDDNNNRIRLKREDRQTYEKARNELVSAMNDVTKSIVKEYGNVSIGNVRTTSGNEFSYQVAESLRKMDSKKYDTYGMYKSFDWSSLERKVIKL